MAEEAPSREQLNKGLQDFVHGQRDTPEAQLWIADDIRRQEQVQKYDRLPEPQPSQQLPVQETGQLALFGALSEA